MHKLHITTVPATDAYRPPTTDRNTNPRMSTTSTPRPDLRTDDYDNMLDDLDRAIEELTEKIENGRIRDPERDKVRLKMYKTLGYLIRTRRKVMEDATLQELEAEIEELKAAGEA